VLSIAFISIHDRVVVRVDAFNLALMVKRGKRGLKRTLDGESGSNNNGRNKGLGQEITGVTLPSTDQVKGWEFGERKTLACAKVNNKYYAIQGDCPRCGFDLWQGDIIDASQGNDAGFEELPRIACPTCSTTYSLETGKFGPPLKRSGLAGFVSGLAKQATQGDKPKNAQVFQITIDETDGRVYCRNKTKKSQTI
jgi:nitrite reductase/ring-hydroxylating ferredoxin subunit